MIRKLGILLSLFLFAFSSIQAATQDVVGFWKMYDEKTNKPVSVVAIYQHRNKFYGRLIANYEDDETLVDTIYHPINKAPGVKGNPYYSGLDFIWDMKPKGAKYGEGKILDPQKGDVYDAEMWLDKGNLVVRGEILVFGKNQTWVAFDDSEFTPDFKKPDLNKMIPNIPKVNK